ncbi:MAG: hypothetical protein ACI3XR_07380 [Eubacteriales bacterium]
MIVLFFLSVSLFVTVEPTHKAVRQIVKQSVSAINAQHGYDNL